MRLRKFIANMGEYLNENHSQTYSAYHSSNKKFTHFDLSKITNLGGDLYGWGFYFTNNINYSKKFGKYTYRCEITLNNPLNLTNSTTKEQLTNILENTNLSKINSDTILELINGNNFTTAFRYIRKYVSFDELKNMFDGVIGYADADGGGKEYVVYNPENIKIIEIIDNIG